MDDHDAARGATKEPGLFLLAYFIGRFLIEFLKEPEGVWSGVLNTAQWLSVPGVLIGIIVLQTSVRARKPAGWAVAAG